MNRLALLSALSLLFLGQGCGLFCIAEGSLISTPTGGCQIEQLREGDAVYSVDTKSGALVEARITAIRRSVRECMSLELHGQRLRCTPCHPIYDPETGSYRAAGEWITSDATMVSRVVDGNVIGQAVTSVSAYAGLLEVFDLTVDGPHSNFIADGVVVHNKTPNDSGYEYDYSDHWLKETPEIPCDAPIPPGHLCLTIESRQYQFDVSNAALNGTVLNMVFESSASEDALPRLAMSFAADATASVSCDDPNTSIVLEFSEATASSHLDGETKGCSLTIGNEPASPGATLSGAMTAVLQWERYSYDVEAEWVDIPVVE